MKILLALILGGFLASCSGLRGKGDDLFEQGAYWQSIEAYEGAIAENPRDEKAHAGLRRARTQFIDAKLIEIRKARFAGSQRQAVDTLLELVKLQSQWEFFPRGALAGTQEEESHEALAYIEGQIASAKAKDRPLSALYLLTHYEPVFAGSLSPRREFLLRQLTVDGKKQCSALSRNESGKQPYYSEFVRKVCAAWGVLSRNQKKAFVTKRSELYRRVKVHAAITGLPNSLASELQKALERSFQDSPWFDSEGSKTLNLSLRGNYVFSHNRSPESRVHGYQVQVPYTDYQTITKETQVPYSDLQQTCHYDSTQKRQVCDYVPVTRYRTQTHNEQQPVTRHRSESRFQNYNGWSHRQNLSLQVEGQVLLAGVTRPLRFQKEVSHEGFEHHWNMPGIGLAPETVNLETPLAWVQQQGIFLGADLLAASEEIWDQRYCEQAGPESTLMATGDQIHRCLRYRRTNPPDFANLWYEKFFGLSIAQADELLKLADL